jgi:hypothetical protein
VRAVRRDGQIVERPVSSGKLTGRADIRKVAWSSWAASGRSDDGLSPAEWWGLPDAFPGVAQPSTSSATA